LRRFWADFQPADVLFGVNPAPICGPRWRFGRKLVLGCVRPAFQARGTWAGPS